MPTPDFLTSTDGIEPQDIIPVWSRRNRDTRGVSFGEFGESVRVIAVEAVASETDGAVAAVQAAGAAGVSSVNVAASAAVAPIAASVLQASQSATLASSAKTDAIQARDAAAVSAQAAADVVAGAVKKTELAATTAPRNIGYARRPLVDAIASTLDTVINGLELSILEFIDSVAKPTPADPSTWTWTTAFALAQAAVNQLGGGTIKIPKGTYYLDGTGIQSLTSPSGFQMNASIRYLGEGAGTIISRRETAATDFPNRADPATFHQAAFNLHGSNHIIENLYIRDSKTAIYMGQKNGEVDTCNVSFCKVRSVWIANCGIGLHMRSGVGNYYNTFEDVHVFQCQIGEYFDSHPSTLISSANNNRNHIRMVRNARCHVGLWVVKGDTNQLIGLHGEGNNATPTNNRYPAPSGIPFGAASGIAQIFEAGGTNTVAVGCMNESNGLDLVNGGVRNSFAGLYADESGKVRHIVRPYFYSTQTMSVSDAGNTFWFANSQTDSFAGYSAGVTHHDSVVEMHNAVRQVVGLSYKQSFIFDAGAVASGAAFNVTLWGENDVPFPAAKVARFDVKVLGNSQADGLVISTAFTIISLRNNSRTITSYYAYDSVNGRALGPPNGDATQPFVPTMSAGGTNAKDLILTITAPPRVFVGVAVCVDRMVR